MIHPAQLPKALIGYGGQLGLRQLQGVQNIIAARAGNVYRGLDTQTGEPVAIKALKPEIVASNPDLV